jgi:hypothetical protein
MKRSQLHQLHVIALLHQLHFSASTDNARHTHKIPQSATFTFSDIFIVEVSDNWTEHFVIKSQVESHSKKSTSDGYPSLSERKKEQVDDQHVHQVAVKFHS